MNDFRQQKMNVLASSGLNMFRNPGNFGDGDGGGIILDFGKVMRDPPGFINEKSTSNFGGYWPSMPSSMFGSKPSKASSLEYVDGGGVAGMISSIMSQRSEKDFPVENMDNEVDIPQQPTLSFLQSSVIAKFMHQAALEVDGGAAITTTSARPSKTAVAGRDQWAALMAISYSILLIVLTGLVATLFAQQSSNASISLVKDSRRKSVSLISQGWIVTSGDCKFWYDGACVPMGDGKPNEATLGGIMDERERKAFGVFSSINAPFLCLAACVISTAFSLCLMPSSDQNVKRMLKMMSILVIVVFGVLFLFIQSTWSLPVNNLLLVECLLAVAMFVLVTYSVEKGSVVDITRLIEMILTNPLIAISVLSSAGDDNTNSLILVYGTLILGFLILMVNYIESACSDHVGGMTPGLAGVAQMSYWLCMIPFIVQFSFRFHYMVIESTVSQPAWSIAALAFTFAAYIIRAIMISLKSWYDSMESEGTISSSSSCYLEEHRGASRVADDYTFRSTGLVWFPILDLSIKLVVSLIIVIGFFIELQE